MAAIHTAIDCNNTDVLKLLLSHKDIDINIKTISNRILMRRKQPYIWQLANQKSMQLKFYYHVKT